MTVQEEISKTKSHLLIMGYKEPDINRAIQAGQVGVNQAIEFLSANQPPASQQTPSANKMAMDFPPISSRPSLSTSPSAQSKLDRQPGGLTNARNSLDCIEVDRVRDNRNQPSASTTATQAVVDDDLQRAMDLSRKEKDERDMAQAVQMSQQTVLSNPAPDQDPELMRAIEESLRENPPTSDRKVSWQPPFNGLKERIRTLPDQPVGLRNIGNTCYLNSLLQVYFHLPDFRRAIMSFRPPDTHMSEDNTTVGDQMNSTDINPDMMQTSSASSMDIAPDSSDPNQAKHTQPPDAKLVEQQSASNTQHALQFVVELQKLFAAMALGNQNCVDPTGVAHAMRDSDGNPITIGAQQDASEFNHLFLDIAERGLSASTSTTASTDHTPEKVSTPFEPTPCDNSSAPSKNVVKEMFTVMFRQEVRKHGIDGENGNQNNCVTMNGETNAIIVDATSANERNLHSGLDDYAFARIEYNDEQSNKESTYSSSDKNTEDKVQPAKQTKPIPHVAFNLADQTDQSMAMSNSALKSVWFTTLPPVVVIYLQRVRFNRETSQAEKVNDRFDFQSEIALDRYLDDNRSKAEHAREIVQGIKRERANCTAVLNGYKKFPHNTLQNQGSTGESNTPEVPLATFEAPHGRRDISDLSTRTNDPSFHDDEPFFSAAKRVRTRLQYSLDSSSSTFYVSKVSKEELVKALETLDTVLEHDHEHCNIYEKKLQALDEKESEAYRELNRIKYRLHAVLVHDGAPSGGHYWTFIRNWGTNDAATVWMKLSDSAVSYVAEEEMVLWSAGGNGRASAYCLIYVVRPESENNNVENETIAEESRNLLPAIRVEEVEKSCAEFNAQVDELTRTDGTQAPS